MKNSNSINLLKNKYVLYFIFLLSLLHIAWFIYSKHIKSILVFTTSCLVIYLINKNMIVVLGLSIIIVDLFALNKKEGFEANDSIKDSIKDSINESIKDSINESIRESITNSIIESNANLNMDISNNDSTMDISNNEYETFVNEYDDSINDTESMSNYMEDKTIIKKLNPTVINSIKKMNSIYIEELNKNMNVLNNLKDL